MAIKKPSKPSSDRKTEALSIRIDPRLKYGLELLSRHQRRAVTGVVEWALSEALSSEVMTDVLENRYTLANVLPTLWSENEIERLLALWFHFPTLLTYEESRLVNVLLRTDELWHRLPPTKQGDFKLTDVLHSWEKFKPVLTAVADRTPQIGMLDDDLDAAGLNHLTIPF